MSLYALFHSVNRHHCDEIHLVLQSVKIFSEVRFYEGQYYLLIDDYDAHAAYVQLRLYVDENAPQESIVLPLLPFKQGFVAAYIFTLVLLIFGILQNTTAFGIDWLTSGIAHSDKILSGQWWRSITALSLHANTAHMAGNIGFGALLGLFVSQHIGSGAAWLSILLAGATGNWLNAYLYQSTHLSIGASTMVFAALGMLGVFALNANKHQYQGKHRRGLRYWSPFIATLALLALTGTAGEKTDVLAHLSGYFSGCFASLLWLSTQKHYAIKAGLQSLFKFLALLLIIVAWGFAIY